MLFWADHTDCLKEIKYLKKQIDEKNCDRCYRFSLDEMRYQNVIEAQQNRLITYQDSAIEECKGHNQQIDTLLLCNKKLREELETKKKMSKSNDEHRYRDKDKT